MARGPEAQTAFVAASRVVFSQILLDEKKGSAVAFLKATLAYYASLGTTMERVMTDNGPCYVRLSTRLTVAAGTPACMAMCLPVSRCRRNAAISSATLPQCGLGLVLGRDERSAMPAAPSARNRSTPSGFHLRRYLVCPLSLGFGTTVLNNVPSHLLSTSGCQTHILADVHSVLRESLKL